MRSVSGCELVASTSRRPAARWRRRKSCAPGSHAMRESCSVLIFDRSSSSTSRPVVQAVPVERAFGRTQLRADLLLQRLGPRHAARAAVVLGHHFVPEVRVEGQIQQRAVQVQQQRVDVLRQEHAFVLHLRMIPARWKPSSICTRTAGIRMARSPRPSWSRVAAAARRRHAGADRPRHDGRPGRSPRGRARHGHAHHQRRGDHRRLARPGDPHRGPGHRPALPRRCSSIWPASWSCAARASRRSARASRVIRTCGRAGRDLAGQVLEQPGVPTRAHLARALVAAGMAESTQDAFDRWLGRGTAGHVPQEWPASTAPSRQFAPPGGHAVLAHAHRYKLSAGALRQPVRGIPRVTAARRWKSACRRCRRTITTASPVWRVQHGLAGSAGSDFHEPGVPWRPLGRFAKLPEGIEPLHARLD